ncbi:2-oxo-4-hydroxy-4-carboxy-5-ureidoimidazoline decarboxylase [Actinomadura sp. WMMA1423]|uniref:2-oxo-4-hydroxy-4-carboxy-5-ureidoimidazoline decarboxylase n=1 Tax=Actinomadura sp. WMMA1423 TaxID=2591108 RepID=UPI001F0DC8CE|nr:2-oxo-4-hydroxy-4-carboxy-5-ureidoimidazoline decarboxylase [Actinomadura sp. WMMA1423]
MVEPSAEELAACCASRRWVAAVAGRSYADLGALRAASRRALDGLDWPDVEEALAAHPRIGDRVGGGTREARWSRGEQAGAADAAGDVQDALTAGNRAYEERFGHVFLVRASGRSATEMLGALRERLCNDPAAEREVVRRELAEIVDLRLARLVEEDA